MPSTTSLIQSISSRNGINRDISSSRPTARSTLRQSISGSLDGNSLDFGDTEEHDLFSSDANWLSRFTPFDVLSPSALEELVACATEVSISPGQVLVKPSQDSPADEVFIVRRGQAEEQSFDPGIGSEEEGLPLTRQTIVPGCVIGWSEVLANKPYRHKVVSTTLMKLWTIPATYLRRISQQPMRRAQYAKSVTRLVARQMEGLEAAIVEEKKNSMARTRALTPYLVPPPKRGVIGNSAYADRLRKALVKQSRDATMKPLLIFGEKGLDKSGMASLVHYGGSSRNLPMVSVNAGRLDMNGSELFGRGEKQGLLDLLKESGGGTLLLNGVHEMPPALLPRLINLLKTGDYKPRSPGSVGLRAIPSTSTASASATSTNVSSNSSEGGSRIKEREGQSCLMATHGVRVILTAEKPLVSEIEAIAETIKVPPLRLRPSDVKDYSLYFLGILSPNHHHHPTPSSSSTPSSSPLSSADDNMSTSSPSKAAAKGDPKNISAASTPKAAAKGVPKKLTLTKDALKRLEAYHWPGNVVELEGAVIRAATMNEGGGRELQESVFWTAAQSKDRFRINLLTSYPLLKQFLRSSIWPEDINFKFTAIIYPLVLAVLFFGPQDRDHNTILNVFWTMWWPVVFISFLFLGRIWCSVCPFMIYGELVQRWRLSNGVKLMKWPREAFEKYGPWFLFVLFGAILVWEEVWDLPHSAALSGWLLVLITAGAVAFSAFFERRIWCRYLCPIGGMNGMFAKISMTEVRARQGVCTGECSTYNCYKGGCSPPPSEGLDTNGCPLYSHPAQMVDNSNCTNCMTCLKACPNGSVEFRLRPPGIELWTTHEPSVPQLSLLAMLGGAVILHDLPQLSSFIGLHSLDWDLKGVSIEHIGVSCAVLTVPGLVAYGIDAVATRNATIRSLPATLYHKLTSSKNEPSATSVPVSVPEPSPFLSLAYGYLPFVWAATLAHYLPYLMSEAGLVLRVTGAMLNLPSSWINELPTLTAHPAVVRFHCGWTLMVGCIASLLLTRKVGDQTWVAVWPQCLAILLFTAGMWNLEGI